MILTERLKMADLLDGNNQGFSVIAKKVLDGAVFIYPTETIYGIGGRADRDDVEERIKNIKGRNKQSPFIIIAGDRSHFDPWQLHFTEKAHSLADTFWPGNLTLVLDAQNEPDGVGIRVSIHPFINELYKELDVPIFSTSANLSDQQYKNDPDFIFSLFNNKVDFMIDAGVLPDSKPSTIVKVAKDDTHEILREGAIESKRLLSVLNLTPLLASAPAQHKS
jgi:L-threonylcarbamoyladenylate synthase